MHKSSEDPQIPPDPARLPAIECCEGNNVPEHYEEHGNAEEVSHEEPKSQLLFQFSYHHIKSANISSILEPRLADSEQSTKQVNNNTICYWNDKGYPDVLECELLSVKRHAFLI